MNKIFTDLKASFDTHSLGMSARKLTAWSIVVCVLVAHAAWLKYAFVHEDFSLFDPTLLIDYAFIGALLGMTSYSANQANKNKPKDETPT